MASVSRRGYFRGTAAALGGLLAAACGETVVGEKPPAAPAPTKEPVTISWGTAGRPDLAALFQGAVDKFHARQSRIRVELEIMQEGGFAEKLDTRIAGGNPPTVIRSGEAQILARVPSGAIAAIDPYIRQTKYDLTVFYPNTVEAHRWKGKLYGLPWIAFVGMIWSNISHFNTAGVSLPKNTWTWDEMLETARRLTKGDVGSPERIFGLGLADRWEWHQLPLVHSWGGKLFDDDLDPTKMVIDTSAVEALQWYADLYNVHQIAPKAADRGELSAVGFFSAGRDAMFMSAVQVQDMRTQAKFGFDIHKLPTGKAGFAAGSTTGSFAVMSGVEHIPEGFEFISYLAGEEGQRALMGFGAQIPAHKKVAESDEWVRNYPPNNRAAAIETLKVAKPAPRGPFWEEVLDVLRKAYAPVLASKQSALQGLQVAQPQVNEIIRKYL